MKSRRTLTFVLMDAPYESARTTTAMRLLNLAALRGHEINVFAYEGAVYLTGRQQTQHPNPVHANNDTEENHPLPKEWVQALLNCAEANGGTLDWANCGLCVDERGASETIEGVRRGTPADLLDFLNRSDNALVIPTR